MKPFFQGIIAFPDPVLSSDFVVLPVLFFGPGWINHCKTLLGFMLPF